MFILLGNLMGQIPGLGAPTSNVNVPFALRLTVWLYYHCRASVRRASVAT